MAIINKPVTEMNEKTTKLRKATKTSKSLVTTVPIELVEKFHLKEGYKINWSWKLNDHNEYEFKISFEDSTSEYDKDHEVSLNVYEK